MKNRVIIVEGIPGSGKSTCAKKLEELLREKGIKVRLYNEGMAHPVDMAWHAYLTVDEYRALLDQYPQYEKTIKAHTQIEEGYVTIAYTQLEIDWSDRNLVSTLESHEVYDGRVDRETFEKLHLKRWSHFKMAEDEVAIFECAFLQNQISELMGVHQMPKEYINHYLVQLLQGISQYKPLLIYLTQKEVEETIMHVAKERVSTDKSKRGDWIDMIIRYVEESNYGKTHHLKGVDGVIQFYKDRKAIEIEFLNQMMEQHLDLTEVEILINDDYNWGKLNDRLKEIICNRY
ncbi:MAG: thymidylate kinase [Cellulosilyticum sp.]|nr:thymidylate kinase [Cellulosilyticum sp.]